MDEQQASDDSDQQKKVTFNENEKDDRDKRDDSDDRDNRDKRDDRDNRDDRAQSSKDNKDQGQDEHDDEGRRSRASRSSRSSSADSFTGESDDLKLKRMERDKKLPKEVDVPEKKELDMKDGLGDDIGILEKGLTDEGRKGNTVNDVNEGQVEKEKKSNKNSTNNETVKTDTKPTDDGDDDIKDVDHGTSGSMGYSLNSRRPAEESKDSTEEASKKRLDSGSETSTTAETDDKKLANTSSSETSKEDFSKDVEKDSRVMKWEEDQAREEQKSDKTKEPLAVEYDNSTKQLSETEEGKDESQQNEKNDYEYQTDDVKDEAETQNPTSEQEKETKVTVNVHETSSKTKNEDVVKPRQQSYTKSSAVKSSSRKQDAESKAPARHTSNQSYPRPTQKETLSPREIVENQRRERRQKSQSARYPPQTKSSSRDATMATRASSRASTVRSYKPPSRPRTCLGFPSERSRRDKEFFHAELQRLKDSLRKESKKIKKPKVRDHYPDVFTSLAPYYNTYTCNYLIKMPDLGYKEAQPAEAKKPESDNEETKDLMYTTRNTAIGLCDPWDSLNMDRSVLPKLETAEIRRKRIAQMHESNKPKSGRASSSTDRSGKTDSPSTNNEHDSKSPRQKKPEAKQGSTRLPKFPVIAPPNSDLTTKELHYGDVPMLRDEMIKSFSHFGEERKKTDYNRTKQDFYRMELDRLDEYHHTTRPHMRAAYFAYLQNTPGSKQAIRECMKQMETTKKKEEPTPQAVA